MSAGAFSPTATASSISGNFSPVSVAHSSQQSIAEGSSHALLAKPAIQPLPNYTMSDASPSPAAAAATTSPSAAAPLVSSISLGAGGTPLQAPYAAFHSPPGSSVRQSDAASPGGSLSYGNAPGPLHVLLPSHGSSGMGFDDASLDPGQRSLSSTRHGAGHGGGAPHLLLGDDEEDPLHEERACCSCCCAGCRSCACTRCLSHAWFLCACCGFLLLSSLPRLLTVVDFIVTALIYSLSFAGRTWPSLSFWDFLKEDFAHYSFRRSGGLLVILSLARMVVLFVTFAYRFHLRKWAFATATTVASISVLFVVVQWSLNSNPHLWPLLLFSLTMTMAEYAVWIALRRQRISRPDLNLDRVHAHMRLPVSAVDEHEHSENSATAMHDDLENGGGGIGGHIVHVQPSKSLLSGGGGGGSSKQSQSYQRLGGEAPHHHEEQHREALNVATPAKRIPSSSPATMGAVGSFTTASSLPAHLAGSMSASGSIPGAGTSMPAFPRSLLTPMMPSSLEKDLDPQSLADPDSLFVEIDSIIVHCKLSVGGKSIVGKAGDALTKQLVAQALEGLSYPTTAASTGRRSDADERAAGSAGGRATSPLHDALRSSSMSEETPLRRSSSSAAASPAATPSSATGSSAAGGGAAHPFPHPVVLMHGFGSSLFQWRALWSELSAQCAVVLAFDRPGFGLTSRPLRDSSGSFGSFVDRSGADDGGFAGRGVLREQENPYTHSYSVRLLDLLLAKLGLSAEAGAAGGSSSSSAAAPSAVPPRPVLLVGHSTGATVALRYGILHPQRTLGLFLVSPHVLTTGFPALVRSLLKTRLGSLITQQLVRSELGELALKRSWFDSNRIPPEALGNYQRIMRVRHYMDALIEMASSSHDESDADALANLVPHLHKLAGSSLHGGGGSGPAVPVCLLHGLQDRLVDISESIRVYKALKSEGGMVTLIRIDHCASTPMEEFPSLFLEHFWGFLNELESGGGGSSGGVRGGHQDGEHSRLYASEEDSRNSTSARHTLGSGSEDEEEEDLRDL